MQGFFATDSGVSENEDMIRKGISSSVYMRTSVYAIYGCPLYFFKCFVPGGLFIVYF